jgi:hypothetical protein
MDATDAHGLDSYLRVRPAAPSNPPPVVMARVLVGVSVFTVSVIGSPAAS